MAELILTTHILNYGYQYGQMKNIMDISKHTKMANNEHQREFLHVHIEIQAPESIHR
jgi:hypothetical protein